MKYTKILVICIALLSMAANAADWDLGLQAYTFRKFTVMETLERSKALGLTDIELYSKQKLGGDLQGVSNLVAMDAATRTKLKAKLKEYGVRLRAYGVTGAKDEAGWRKLMEMAKDMGIETITSEPSPNQLDYIEKLADEFQINVAFHNHPQPSRYWNPDTVLAACKGRSKRLGACADIGHWTRSGLDPVECIRKLKGRIISLHIKDVNDTTKKGHCVPFGLGKAKIAAVFAELKKQQFKGYFSMEYEHNPSNPYPAVKQCVVYFNQILKLSSDDLLSGKAPKGAMVDDINLVWSYNEPGDSGKWGDDVKVDSTTADSGKKPRKKGGKKGKSAFDPGLSTKVEKVSGNIAFGKTVKASSTEGDLRKAEHAVDGIAATRWASGRSDDEWIAVDLGKVETIDRIKIVWEAAYAEKFKIETSQDGSTWKTVYENDNANGKPTDETIPATKARHVRVKGIKRATQWGYSIYEFAVFKAGGRSYE